MTDNEALAAADHGSVTGCQFSIYPLLQDDIDRPIQAAIAAASQSGMSTRVGNLSTLLVGTREDVFMALKAAFEAACASGPTVMTATLTTGVPSDEVVAEIQHTLGQVDNTSEPVSQTPESRLKGGSGPKGERGHEGGAEHVP